MGKLGWMMVKIFNAASVVFAMVESSIFGASGKEKSLCQVDITLFSIDKNTYFKGTNLTL